MSIKLLTPCPEDDGSTSLSGKNFVAPKKKYNPINLYSMDFELEAAKLDVLDPTGKLNSLCRLTLTQGEAMSQVIKNQEILIEALVNTVNYTMMNDTFNQIMIGVSSNWKLEKRTIKEKVGLLLVQDQVH